MADLEPVGLYECERRCGWVNPDFRYGLADAGMSWAMHMDKHHEQDAKTSWHCSAHDISTTDNCPRCDAELIALAEESS